MTAGSNQTETIPRPYGDILLMLSAKMQPHEMITRHQLHALVRFVWCDQYNKNFNDMMQNLMKYAPLCGFTKHGGTMKATSQSGKLYLERVDANLEKLYEPRAEKTFTNCIIIKCI